MIYTDLMGWYTLASQLTIGDDKYYSLTEYEEMLPFERDIYLEMIVQRQNARSAGTKIDTDDVITEFESPV